MTITFRLAWRNLGTPLEGIRQAVDYPGLDGAKEAVARAGRGIREQGLPQELVGQIVYQLPDQGVFIDLTHPDQTAVIGQPVAQAVPQLGISHHQ